MNTETQEPIERAERRKYSVDAGQMNVERANVMLRPDPARVLVRPFNPSSQIRAQKIAARVLAMDEEDVRSLLEQVMAEFDERHPRTKQFLKRRAAQVRRNLLDHNDISEERELLLAAYFTHEYSLEAAALFNPSIVPHPDQSNLPPGSLRFVLSLRATGEGHISSITFRTGLLDAKNNITINEPTRYNLEPAQAPSLAYEKGLFDRKLKELGLEGDFSRHVLENLKEVFSLDELRASIGLAVKQNEARGQETEGAARKILALAQSNYEVHFPPDSRLSERVLFPVTPSQSNGIE